MNPAILSVPAHKPQWLESARKSGAWIMWDLEDGVPGEHKDEARHNVRFLAEEGDLVRVNQGETLETEAIVVFPKVEIGTLPDPGNGVIIESPAAVWDVGDILSLTKPSVVLFGWADLLASSGLTPASQSFLDSCRERIVLACRAAGVPVYDGPPSGDVKEQAERSRDQGFDGAGCIHPDQVPIVCEAFVGMTERDRELLTLVGRYRDNVPPPLASIKRTVDGY